MVTLKYLISVREEPQYYYFYFDLIFACVNLYTIKINYGNLYITAQVRNIFFLHRHSHYPSVHKSYVSVLNPLLACIHIMNSVILYFPPPSNSSVLTAYFLHALYYSPYKNNFSYLQILLLMNEMFSS